jgi:signal peptidase I
MRQGTVGAGSPAGPAAKGKVREYAEAFGIALVIALVVRTLFLQAFKIPSSSMENTLLVGDHIFVNKFIYGYHIPYTKGRVLEFTSPQHGDIVVFVFPEDPSKDFIKRVIGVPGDVLELRHKVVYRNGKALTEPYARYADGTGPEGYVPSRDDMRALRVPAHKYFVMGDNRDRSYDSRFWGFVDEDALIGKALFIYFSIDWSRGFEWTEFWRLPEMVRWNRIGHVLR